MLRHRVPEENSDECFICKQKFTSDDDIIKIFDKAFGFKVSIHKYHHHNDSESETLKRN